MPRSKPSLVRLVLITCTLAGCAAAPSAENAASGANRDTASAPSLPGTGWVVEDIDGTGIVDRSRATLEFATDGRVSGNASCNTYRATYELDRDVLTISRAITTRMACPPALMQQEARFLAALTGVRTFEISNDGGLTLRSAAGGSIRARRAPGANGVPR
jgi:heat shock protein HslJ